MITRRRFIGQTIALASAGALASERAIDRVRAADSDWLTVQGNPAHTGFTNAVEGPVTHVESEWQLEFSQPIYAQPVVADGTIVLSAIGPDANTGQLAAVTNGDTRWEKSTSVSVLSSPTIRDGIVYQTGPRSVTARSLSSGSIEWTIDLPTSAFLSPTVINDTVLVGTRTGLLTARSAANGSEQWSTSLDSIVSGTPTVRDDLVVTGTDGGTVAGFDLSTGAERWRRNLGSAITCAPTIAAGSVFVPTESGRLHALDPDNGANRWQTDFTLPTVGSPVVVDDTCYWSGGTDIMALNAADGTERWRTSTDAYTGLGHVSPLPVAAHDTLYVSTGGNTVYALDRTDGSERWTFSPSSGADVLSLVVGDGRLYIGTADGTLLALSGRTNYRPTASFTYSPRNPAPGEEITFDATASSDQDGSIKAYRWDFDGDGKFEATGSTVTHTFETGQQMVRLEVEDNEGAIARTGGKQTIAVGIDPDTTPQRQATGNEGAVLDSVPGGKIGVAGGVVGLLGALGVYRAVSSGASKSADSPETSDQEPSPEPTTTDNSRNHPVQRSDASFGDFELGDSVGTGPLTEVTNGSITGDETPIAIETLGNSSSHTVHEGLFESFANGINMWSRIDDHPNVLSVLVNGTEPFPWAALEWCTSPFDPESVADLSFEDRRSLLVNVLEGVHHGHRHGLYHGALTPNNVLLLPADRTQEEGRTPVVGDWEVSAVQLETELDIADIYPRFATPEQIDSGRFGDPGPLTDIYQLGVFAYAVFTGSYPFREVPSPEPVWGWSEVTPPSEITEAVPPELDDILSLALTVEPDERYQTALHFRDALKRV